MATRVYYDQTSPMTKRRVAVPAREAAPTPHTAGSSKPA